jgi:NTP pyrophosphatase (non-canonical NTP hydrolase)
MNMISEVDINDWEMLDYQSDAWQFAMPTAKTPEYLFAGLAAEAGEVAGLYAKAVRDGMQPEYKAKLVKELGDVSWFVASLCTHIGVSFESVLKANIDKLKDRAERGVIGGSGDVR